MRKFVVMLVIVSFMAPAVVMAGQDTWAVGGVVPDLTLYFDVTPATGLVRRGDRGGGGEELDRIEREDLPFHERVRATYLGISRRHPERFRVVSTEGGEEAVWDRVRPALEEILRRKSSGDAR